MRFPRSSGIILHPTSLPGRLGIGGLGKEAYAFADFLASAGQRIWQVLPLGPTGYGDSPYQCFSAFGGNPLLISLEKVREEGLLDDQDLAGAPDFPEAWVDYGAVQAFKLPLLVRACEIFHRDASSPQLDRFETFCREQGHWLEAYALFMALKEAFGGVAWTRWEEPFRRRDAEAMKLWSERLAQAVRVHQFSQYLFFNQWKALKDYCRDRDIQIMGDLPIFVSHDSADVWAHPEIFDLREDGTPRVVSGVPPDYFSATGQLWGTPLYRWDALERTGYRWWIERFRATLLFMDIVRVDHFRGFQAYWEIPGGDTTAIQGRWAEGPGARFFEAVEEALGPLPIVAENLGYITPEVEQLRRQLSFPGMAVLQFAFGGDPQDSEFLPHNHSRHLAVYTGTHDNDTIVGWWEGGLKDTTQDAASVRRERAMARRYLNIGEEEVHWAFIRAALASVADLAVFPVQDVLGLGNEARMNLPGRGEGNWQWRLREEMLTADAAERLKELTWLYGRTDLRPSWA